MWIHTLRKSACSSVLLLVSVAGAATLLLLFPTAASAGIRQGLTLCGGVLIPGLLPFLVLAGFAVRSGLCTALGRRLEPVTRRLFRLPGCCGAVLLIGLIGGYPAGATAAGALYRRGSITREQGRRLLRCCVNAGPAFAIGTVGAELLHSPLSGVLLYVAHITASLLIGLAEARRAPNVSATDTPPPSAVSPATALAESVTAASQGMLAMSGFVLITAALLAILRPLLQLLPPLWRILTAGLCEIGCGCAEAAALTAAPFTWGLLLGWGGLSVHGQLAADLSGTGLITRRFFGARLLHGLLGGGLSVLLFWLIPRSQAVLSPLTPVIPTLSGHAMAGVSLLVTCGLFLLTLHPKTAP